MRRTTVRKYLNDEFTGSLAHVHCSRCPYGLTLALGHHQVPVTLELHLEGALVGLLAVVRGPDRLHGQFRRVHDQVAIYRYRFDC